MADNDDKGEGTTRGADWEVLQLTGSTYDAASGPDIFDSADETKARGSASENETSAALFMSSHFVFPPKDHENLPIEPEASEIHDESETLSTEVGVDSGSRKDDDEFVTGPGNEVVEGLLDDSQFSASDYEPMEPSGETSKSPGRYAKHNEEKKHDEADLPSDLWWRRRAVSVYRHTKERNTLLSIVVAATVAGLVILGHRWQRGKWQFHKHNWL